MATDTRAMRIKSERRNVSGLGAFSGRVTVRQDVGFLKEDRMSFYGCSHDSPDPANLLLKFLAYFLLPHLLASVSPWTPLTSLPTVFLALKIWKPSYLSSCHILFYTCAWFSFSFSQIGLFEFKVHHKHRRKPTTRHPSFVFADWTVSVKLVKGPITNVCDTLKVPLWASVWLCVQCRWWEQPSCLSLLTPCQVSWSVHPRSGGGQSLKERGLVPGGGVHRQD